MFALDATKFAANLPGSELQRHLKLLRETVPGLLEINMGPTGTDLFPGYVDCSGGFTHCLVSKHTDVKALQEYVAHPNHVTFAELLKASYSKPPIRVDFELKE